jgi:hypothetical protein
MIAKAAEPGGVVTLDRSLAAGGHKSPVLAAAGVYLDCKKRNFARARAPAFVECLARGSFEMDWLLVAILIAAVGAHLIVAGFGR